MRQPLRASLLCVVTVGGCYHPPADLRPPPLEVAPAAASSPPADGAPAPTSPLTCDAAITVAVSHEPALRAARAGLPVARADRDAAGRWEAPELRMGDNVRDLGQETKAELRVRLPGLGVGSAEASAAEARAHLTAAEIRALEVEVALGVRTTYAELALALAEARIDRETAAAARAHVDLVATRASAGTATAVALTEARLAASEAEDLAASTERDAARRRAHLAARLGSPPAEAGGCVGPEAAHGGGPVDAHPAVAAATAAAWKADADAFAEARAAWIWPTYAQIGWARDKAGGNRQDRIVLELGIALPFPGTDASDVARAEADHRRAEVQAAVSAAQGEIALREAAWQDARAHRAALVARAPEIAEARALWARGESAGAPPNELAGLARRVRAHEKALALAEHAEAITAAELLAARGMASARGG